MKRIYSLVLLLLLTFIACEEEVTLPILSTLPISSVTSVSATVGGFIIGDGGAQVTARGVCWDTQSNPTVALASKTSDGTGTGSYSSSLTMLSPGTVYFVRAYATNKAGTVYGNELFFETEGILASIVTKAVSDVASSSAISGGTISSNGGSLVIARGVCWSTSPSPTIDLPSMTSDGSGTGDFTSTISGLLPGTKYFVRAYATNSAGTNYGNETSFMTRL